jgi:hypothetical protein
LKTKKLFHWLIVSCFLILAVGTYAQTPGEWTWMSGVSSANYVGNFGTLGIPAVTNKPAGIYEAGEWTDHQGNFWLYGGETISGWSDNLWKYDVRDLVLQQITHLYMVNKVFQVPRIHLVKELRHKHGRTMMGIFGYSEVRVIWM